MWLERDALSRFDTMRGQMILTPLVENFFAKKFPQEMHILQGGAKLIEIRG